MEHDDDEPPPDGARDHDRTQERPPVGDRGYGEGDRLTESIRQRLEHLVPEMVKKTFAAGMGAVFQTEDSLRKIAKDINLPDVAGYLATSADGAKDKVFEVIARETREFLSNLNVSEEIAKMLTTLSFEIKTEIRFIPNDSKADGKLPKPDVKATVRIKDPKPEPSKSKERDPLRDPKDEDE